MRVGCVKPGLADSSKMELGLGLLRLLVAGLLTGLAIGVVGSAFRGLLSLSNKARDALIAEAHAEPWQGYLAVA